MEHPMSERTVRANAWGHQSEYWALNEELSDLCIRETHLVDSMIKLQSKTPAGIAAVAAAFKADQDHFWKEPEPDRDWHISLLTRFLDGLIDLGQASCLAVRVAPEDGEARAWTRPLIAAPSLGTIGNILAGRTWREPANETHLA
jgi:hypothetical protein